MSDTRTTVVLQDNFYRDCFGKVVLIYIFVLIILGVLVTLAFYLHVSKPKPITFQTYASFRIQPDVPLNQRYLSDPLLLQWVSEVIPQAFNYDFVHYTSQLQDVQHYFTAEGWKSFVNHLNDYANPNIIMTNRLFISATLMGAPSIDQEAYLGSTAAWLVQIPILISYAGYKPLVNKTLTLQVLVVRVSTLSNLNGVGIQNISVLKTTNNQQFENG